MDVVIARLKKQAASLGADGVLLQGTGTEYGGGGTGVSTGVRGGGLSIGTGIFTASDHKTGRGRRAGQEQLHGLPQTRQARYRARPGALFPGHCLPANGAFSAPNLVEASHVRHRRTPAVRENAGECLPTGPFGTRSTNPMMRSFPIMASLFESESDCAPVCGPGNPVQFPAVN